MANQVERPSIPARILRRCWWLRHEITAGTILTLTLCVPLAVGPTRRLFLAWFRCARTRRQILHAFAATRMGNPAGQLPRVRWVQPQPFGERIHVRTRPGHSAELFDLRMEEFRAATKANTVRITRDPHRSHRVTLDVIRRDPLASATVAWEDQGDEPLSLWEAVHLGQNEFARAVRTLLIERSMLIGGQPGSGKSSALTVIVGHAARSDAHLVLIDPNGVQFTPWRDRAWLYAGSDPDEALGVLYRLRAEIDRRLSVLNAVDGVNRKITPELAARHNMRPILFAVDEFAFHTSVAGTPRTQQEFAAVLRDIVSRGRAVLVVTVIATQRPTQDVVPRAISDLFTVRLAFRTATPGNSDVILGDGWVKKGYDASQIDLEGPGVGILRADGTNPVRLKIAWLGDADVHRLSIAAPAFKPTPPPTAPDRPALATVAA